MHPGEPAKIHRTTSGSHLMFREISASKHGTWELLRVKACVSTARSKSRQTLVAHGNVGTQGAKFGARCQMVTRADKNVVLRHMMVDQQRDMTDWNQSRCRWSFYEKQQELSVVCKNVWKEDAGTRVKHMCVLQIVGRWYWTPNVELQQEKTPQPTNQQTAHRVSATLFIASQPPLFPAHVQVHLISRGTRTEQEFLDRVFLHGTRFSPSREGAKAHALWPSLQVRVLRTGR